ncbi:P-loop containing nucleoside triphosphate hydrolase protein [Cantharellus anzutake]|uniref:P-loop containing nucleoside triphosphate hydrolase protein n=1 Tax=Cantharellus anzutake TaxID=1750568 RepID=UPI0019072E84|nr:P-loop containing nucleoside triphosphate hydrolase protein [Cantharellus anzutake]KAF8338299.1 P-loop containing nucleoside triphosphate hydrolase protein [Cantharellus anzutake]
MIADSASLAGPPPPMRVQPDQSACQEWIYPLNRPKRDYQFNIVRKCLFDNTLVALPTGLGKTFVAGCVMLNYYRWFPSGKILFLAPTKPLVSQQVSASHEQCGIPGSAAAELTGSLRPEARKPYWQSKRVFYMTPQAFVRDLHNGNADPLDIILIVVDEAHRATGDYAYCTAIRYMMVKNPHFRVLALTATPGSNAEAVQSIVDNMHISHIEIRDENALDLRDYVHRKHMVQHVVPLTPELVNIFDQIIKLMQKIYSPIGQFLPGADMATMGDYRPTAVSHQLTSANRWATPALLNLGVLARARTYLVTESFEMCHQRLMELMAADAAKQSARSGKKKLAADPLFQSLIMSISELKHANGFIVHPKMDKLKTLLLQHFSSVLEGQTASKVMVFASYRPVVEQIVEHLNEQKPLIRAHRFIGQAASKEGVKGLTQKEQLQVIESFKKNEFNTLVCTSIGEEGLDIGEVDLIVCYDSHKAPIKMLQRVGRTGRKQDGHIIVLVAEGKEEENFAKAKAAYADVQKAIVDGDQLVLYNDIEHLIPDTIRPEVCEKVMPIEPYVPLSGALKKRNGGLPRSMPAGGIEGFVTAKTLVNGSVASKPKSTSKRVKSTLDMNAVTDSGDDESDMDLDAALAARVHSPVLKRINSDHESEEPPKKKRKPKKKSDESSDPVRPKPRPNFQEF